MPEAAPEELLGFCRGNLEDPERGLADLERIARSGGGGAVALLTRLLPDAADPDLALTHLERYCRGGPPPGGREALQALLTILGLSSYLAEALINDRDGLGDLLRGRRQDAWGTEEYRSDLARWLRERHRDDPWRGLRAYKRRVLLRVALSDLQRLAPLVEVCHELSCAADALIQHGLELVTADLVARHGSPQAFDETGRPVPASMAVVALGKLGGMELNYSSDVDLLFLHAADGVTSGGEGGPESQITNQEFFTRAAETLTRELSHIGPDGQVFRVDCRLRPGGRDGDLVVPVQAALVYYRAWAHPWERQSLLKARHCAGDAALSRLFVEQVEPVVFPHPPDPSIPASVRSMKDRIDAELARRSEGAVHLKLGPGGIREIEFVVQALQMMHGGADAWVREANTLLALHRLADRGHLSMGQHAALTTAYTFLREAEHRVQLPRNLQRSTIPRTPRERRMLARAMGYRDTAQRQEAARFLADLEAHRALVRSIYDDALARLSQPRLEEAPAPDPFLDPMPDAEVTARLRTAGVRDPESLLGGVRTLGRLVAAWPPEAALRSALRRTTPLVIEGLARAHHPVRALRNLERYLASLALDPPQLRRLLARPELIPSLIRLFAGSQPLTSVLIHRPGLILEEGFGGAIAADRDVPGHLARLRVGLAGADERGAASLLRVYQRAHMLYVGLKDLSRQAGPAQVRRALSDLAEAMVRAALEACGARADWPVAPTGETPGFVVLGLGKLGYRELDYFSDLDLVFLYDAGPSDAAGRHAAANRLAALLMQMLTSITREGPLYAVDARLRPFGGEGELAQSVERLFEYFMTSAGVWEMQSFLKARPIAGDLALGARAARDLEALLPPRAAARGLPRAVGEMKRRLELEAGGGTGGAADLKLGPGGLSAIQFIIQFLQLRHALASPPHKNTPRLLAALWSAGLLDEEARRALFTGFQLLSRVEHQIRLQHGRAVSRLPASRDGIEEVAAALGYTGRRGGAPADALLEDLERHRGDVEGVFRKVLEEGSVPATGRGGRRRRPSAGNVENPVESRPVDS